MRMGRRRRSHRRHQVQDRRHGQGLQREDHAGGKGQVRRRRQVQVPPGAPAHYQRLWRGIRLQHRNVFQQHDNIVDILTLKFIFNG